MKTLLFLFIISAVFSVAKAENTRCENVAIIAEHAMKIRQSNADLAEVSKGLNDYNKYMLTLAYKKPLYRTKKYKERAIIIHKNTMYAACLNSH